MKVSIFDRKTTKNKLVTKIEDGYKFKNMHEARQMINELCTCLNKSDREITMLKKILELEKQRIINE